MDDEETIAHVLRSVLEDLIQKERFDLLVTDLSMPSLSGIDLAGRAKEVHPELAVVLVNGWPGDRPAAEFRAAGIDRILGKPCLREDLLAAVSAVLARS